MTSIVRRSVALPALALGDTARHLRRLPPPDEVPAGALDAAIRWLTRTHDVTGRRGSSKGFSLLHGWLPPYPETTGYIIGTLLDHAAKTGDSELQEHARQMGDWEIEEIGRAHV